jgi:hypothetical protein
MPTFLDDTILIRHLLDTIAPFRCLFLPDGHHFADLYDAPKTQWPRVGAILTIRISPRSSA